ncbi:MAG: ABC transporter substrate-binding protein [Bauldia sp.]
MPIEKSLVAAFAALVTAIGIAGGAAAQAPAANSDGCVDTVQAGVDYFPDKATVTYAENFTVDYFDTYKVVTVVQPFPGGAPETYVLVQCGTPEPELGGDLADAPVIQIPLPTLFSASATHNPMLDALGLVDRLTGVTSLAYTATASVLERAAAGHIVEFAPTFETNLELVIDARPAALMTGGGDDPAYGRIRDAGIPVVANAEWLEPDILARAEWIKYIALFFNAEADAMDVFDRIDADYAAAAARTADLPDSARPLVFAGSSFQGVFNAPGGASYSAQAMEAAGARYVFADNRDTASLSFADLEVILDRAADAEFWINAAVQYRTLADIEAEEPRLATLPAVQAGQVWNYDLGGTETGALPFWELGVLRPDLILLDLLKIFHPELAEDHAFVFYRSIEPVAAATP